MRIGAGSWCCSEEPVCFSLLSALVSRSVIEALAHAFAVLTSCHAFSEPLHRRGSIVNDPCAKAIHRIASVTFVT